MADKENLFLHNINFLPIPDKLKSLLTLISFRANIGECRHSDGKMGRMLGVTDRAIRARLWILVDSGFVTINNPGSPKNRTLSLTKKTKEILGQKTQDLLDNAEQMFLLKKGLGENSPTVTGIDVPSDAEQTSLVVGTDVPTNAEQTCLHNNNLKNNPEEESIIITDVDIFSKSFFLSVKSDLKKCHREIILLEELIRFISKCKESNSTFDDYDHALNTFKSWMEKLIIKELKKDEYYRDHNFHQAMEENFQMDAKKMFVHWKKFLPILNTLNEVNDQYDINQAFYEFLTTKKDPKLNLEEKKYIDQIEKKLMSFTP